jgi:rhodanese-related sulfurtransferase
MMLILILIALGIAVAGWYWYEGRWDRQLFSAEPGHVCVNLNAKEARAWLEAHPETQVLDVRSADEFSKSALPGAVNISVGDAAFETKVSALNRQQAVLVYCAGGFRSRKAVERIKALGFENIQHLHRGYMSW